MTQNQVVALMTSSTSEDDWNKNCDKVKKAHNGKYPDYWYPVLIASGIAERVAATWSGSHGITVHSL